MDVAADIGFLIGALVPTFLISRLILWVMRSWDGGITRLAVAHVFSWLVTAFVAGVGMADGGAFAGIKGAITYAIPQGFWFFVDIVRHWRRLRRAAKPPQNSN